ncbi:phage tail protein [Clostridium tetani]|uniref:phage tail protein n=1 Tax=Clostridium tetani TaxID=1513 RepID=UPI002954C41E|nr:phage tail protein [Clostridium tetani]BDR86144.1 tail fiber protein [Clostridium tetani]
MAEQFYTILTAIGKAKIANATALGNKVNFTTLKIGDSNGKYYNPTESQEDLINAVWQGNINSISVDKKNPNWIVIEVIIPSNIGGFVIREAGIFDDEGNLIAIGKYPETYKPKAEYGSTKDLIIKMILEVSNTSTVTLKVDPTVILATKEDIEVLENKIKNIKVPVESVNSKTGKVELTAADIKAEDGTTLEEFKTETESQLADTVKKEQIYGNKTEIVGMNVSGEYSSYGNYGIIFKAKQTINLKTVDIDTNKTQTVKVALAEWYDDLSKEIKEGEALFTKELSLKQGLNKYTLDFLIPNDGKTYFLYTIGQMEDTKRRDFAPPINAYIDFIKGGRAVPDDSTKKRQVINKWYWFFNWEIETSIEQNLNKLFTFADNGKKDWVDIVGSPLLNADSFSTLKSKTQTLKNTFASNLKDKKINASGTESLDNLINKIKNINVGKKWASGTTLNSSSLCTISNLDFKPSTIIWCINYYESSRTYMNYISVLINNTISFNALESDSWSTKMSTNTTISTSSDGFSVNATYPHYNKKTIWYAFE